MNFFPYGQTEMDYLKKKDKRLGAAIDGIGLIKREISSDPFCALVESIVSQQISSKAADTICERIHLLVGELNPINILSVDADALQKCGISQKKTQYIRGIAEAAKNEIDFSALGELSDEDIIKKLIPLKGVGVWTVEMLLIFCFTRPNVLSFNDLAIKRGMMRLYGHKEITSERFEKYRKRYSPYNSVASLYLWELSSR